MLYNTKVSWKYGKNNIFTEYIVKSEEAKKL